MFLNVTSTDVQGKAMALLGQIKDLTKLEMTAEDKQTVANMLVEAKALKDEAHRLSEIERLAAEVMGEMENKQSIPNGNGQPSEFKSLGEFANCVFNARFNGYVDSRLGKPFRDPNEPEVPAKAKGWVESRKYSAKDLQENVGASGGYLVPIQQMTNLLQVPAPPQIFRPRATVVPMQRRQIQWPSLDQTNTTAGEPAWFGGVLASWTEEAAEKDETEPTFRQINLVAHKLVCYTEATDELLEDSAVSLEALLGQLMTGAGDWYEERAFIRGTGAGQPLGVIPAGATFHQVRHAAGHVNIEDVINMLEHFHGSNPVWLSSRSCLPDIFQMQDPEGHYVFIPNARDGEPQTMFGYPLLWNEHCPLLGQEGDLILADLKMYLIGDRKGVAIDASKDYKFRDDKTVWRAVRRVDGQPWLSQPIYLADGTTQVSPFVILDNLVS